MSHCVDAQHDMRMRKPIVAANWKMNPAPHGWNAKDSPFRSHADIDVIVFPTMNNIDECVAEKLLVGGQYGRPESSGAFTGDVSMQQLKADGCRYVLCGHSDRRRHHEESDSFVGEQAAAALDAGLMPIICVGETADERELGKAQEAVKRQIDAIDTRTLAASIIAYEPVWAIGTGNTATAKDAQEMHAFIRTLLPQKQQHMTHILYGGSVKPDNAAELIEQLDIDGFLVGTCSLKPDEFRKIIDASMPKA